MLLEDKETY